MGKSKLTRWGKAVNVFFAFVLMFSFVPTSAFADEGANANTPGDDAVVASENMVADEVAAQGDDEAEAAAITSSDKVYIQDTQDKNSSYSYKSGTLSAGDTLWANVYTASGYSYSSVPNDGTFTYQWMRSTTKSTTTSDYTNIEGATSQSLTITNDLAGNYIIVKVTSGDVTLYGPAVTYGSGINSNYIPGPVLGAGQAELYKVAIDKTSPAVDDTITATAYATYSTPVSSDVNVTWTWSCADSKYGTYTTIEGQTGNTLKVTEDLQGKYIKVNGNAGVNDEYVTTSDAVLAKGSVKLAGVELSAPATEIGTTLTAKAYTGSTYSPTYVTEGVTYTWKYSTSKPSYSTTWTTIEGQTGSTFTVTGAYENYYISVSASAGANTVDLSYYSAPGPFLQAGAVIIYSGSIVNPKTNASVFAVGDTAKARGKEQGASDFIDASKLNFQWKVGESKSGPWTDIEGQTSETMTLGSDLEGKYINCTISSKVGSSSYTVSRGCLVAAAGSVNISSLTLDKSSDISVGDELTATAKSGSTDVTSDEHVKWSWYYGDTSSTATTQIAGANTNKLTLTSDYVGKYIKVVANGGYGDESKTTSGAVQIAGGVELHKVEATGTPKVGNTLAAQAYKNNSSTKVGDSDVVTYQWQYANTKTTTDSAFTDIEGATGSTYVVGEDMVGKYIRVKAVSNNTVVSTSQKSYYSTSSVDPLGPVTLAGAYDLSSVALSSTGQAMQAGSTITPQAKVKQSTYYESDAPEDAKLVYTWYVSDSGTGAFAELDSTKYPYSTSDGKLVLDESLVGKYLKVSANAIQNTVDSSVLKVLGANEYELMRVNLNPSTGDLVTGDTLSATTYAKKLDGTSLYGDDVTSNEGVSYQWYAGSSANADDTSYMPIKGATSKDFVVPDAAFGMYLKVVATSGDTSVTAAFPNPVIYSQTLDGVVAKLNKDDFRLMPEYGTDTNVNDMLLAKIESYGYKDVSVKVVAADNPSDRTTGASGGVSAADDATNGNIEYFYIDPAASTWSFYSQRQLEVTFEIEMNGETITYTPSKTTSLNWDEGKASAALKDYADQLQIVYSGEDTALSVTQNVLLPNKVTGTSWASVEWSTSNSDSIAISGYSWNDTMTGKVSRMSSDKTVYLTAKISMKTSGGFSNTFEKEYELTVKGDPEKVASDIAKLQEKVDAGFTYENVKYFGTEDVSSSTALVNDQQLPRPATLGIEGGDYSIKYTATDGTDSTEQPIVINGYRTYVYQDLPGGESKKASITITVTDRQNADVTASKTLEYTVAPMDQTDLDKTVELMKAAKAGYAEAILEGQSADAVTKNMHAFQKAYYNSEGKLAWTYTYDDPGNDIWGIVPVELPGYDSMSWMTWRLFKSSKNSVVRDENLLVTQPTYNTNVTITSSLSSDKYARYAERYPDNATFASLKEQLVSATVTVLGTTGQDNPDAGKTFEATARITGISEYDENGNYSIEPWVPTTTVNLPVDEDTTAWDVFAKLLDEVNCTYSFTDGAYSGFPASITNADGRKLGMTSSDGNWSYWAFYVNGAYASNYCTQQNVNAGDVIELTYISGTGSLKKESIADAKVEMEHKADYTGEAVEPAMTVTLGDTQLIKDRDFTVSYTDADGNVLEGAPIEHGVYTVTLTGIEDYEGTLVAGEFTISKTTDAFKRLAGEGREQTMSQIVGEAFDEGSCTEAILVSNSSFADALSASSLAGVCNCPVILTDSGSLSSEAAAELARIAPENGIIVTIVGGSAAVSDDVMAQVEALDCVSVVERIYGSSRVETANAVYEAGAGSWSNMAIVAKGENFADALSIASYAYASKSPIFLTSGGTISDSTAAAIKGGKFESVIVTGGTGGDGGIQNATIASLGIPWLRLAGETRLETSVAIANWAMNKMDVLDVVRPVVTLSCDGIGIANSKNFPDALAATALLGQNRSVLLLADDSDEGIANVKSMVSENKDLVSKGYIFGGDAAVKQAVEDAANAALKGE